MTLTKVCHSCRVSKHPSNFSKHRGAEDGLQSCCKSCQKISYAKLIEKSKANGTCRCGKPPKKGSQQCVECRERALNALLKNKYGITLQERSGMIASQGGACLICKRSLGAEGRTIAIDHDHVTNKIRGILCLQCNTGLGNFCDSVEILERAIWYLRETRSKPKLRIV